MKLPKLDKNIKNGNSLISGTDEELKKYFGKNFRNKKPINWQEEFPEVFKQGGFDVIIGNPPYVNLANIKDVNEREYLKHEFATAKNKSDLYSFFAEKAIRLLKESGFLGLIFSNSWLGTDSFSKFREFLIKNTKVIKLVKLPPDVFASATVTTVLIFLRKKKVSGDQNIKLFEYVDGEFTELTSVLSYERIKKSPGFSFSFDKDINFKVPTTELGKIVKFSLGVKTSDDKRFVSNTKRDEDSYKLLRGKDVGRYRYVYAGKWIWYKPDLMMDKVGAGPRKLEYFFSKKILIKDVAQEIIATYDDESYLTTDTLSLIYQAQDYDLKFILAILNSRIINQWFKVHFPAGLHIKINQLEHIPVPKVSGGQQHQIVNLVDKILQLNRELAETPENSNKWNSIKSEIEKTNKKIDEEVYKLYGLTPEEIEIVEKHTLS
jgi:type I restriction-modification system DNA methylase subunit